jgi:HAD superfamily hydrolase (TIGR01509 family)
LKVLWRIENSKPDPEVFLLAVKNVGVSPAHCLVVEDAVAGIESARRAGMKSLAELQTCNPYGIDMIKNISEMTP